MNDDQNRWLRYWRFLSSAFRPEVRAELEFHVEQRTRELIAQGMPADAARREAERRLGDRERVASELDHLETRRGRRLARAFSLAELRQDLGYGVRGLLRHPVFALTAAASLALGIATTTVAFSLMDTLILRPLPVRDPSELVVIGGSTTPDGLRGNITPFPAIRELAGRTDLFKEVAADRLNLVGLRAPGADQAEIRLIRAVTGNWFGLLGVSAAVGRLISEDDQRQRAAVVVLEHTFWTQRMAADPSVVGSTMMVNGFPFTIVGVAAKGFRGMQPMIPVAAYVTTSADAQTLADPRFRSAEESWDSGWYLPVARLQEGRSIEQVRAALQVMSRTLRAEHPEMGEQYMWGAEREGVVRVSYAAAGLMPIMGAVFFGLAALVLLTACVNVTSLLLTRAAGRRGELAVRQAMGASRLRLARQLLTETVLIALVGLVGAWALAWGTVRAIGSIPIGIDVPVRFDLAFDARVFGLAALAALAAGLLAGLAPAITGTRHGPSGVLREEGRGSAGSVRAQRFRAGLVAAQVAVSVTLVTAAILFVLSTRRAAGLELGFQPSRILTVTFNPSLTLRDQTSMRQAFDRILTDVRQLPGVEMAAWSSSLPLYRSNASGPVFVDDPGVRTDRSGSVVVGYASVSPDYFATLGIELLAGRGFAVTDDSVHPRVAIVNRRAAEMLWPGREPIGQHFRFEADGSPIEVVGIAPGGRYNFLLESPQMFAYLPFGQQGTVGEGFLAIRATGDPHALDRPVRAVFRTASPDFVPVGFLSLEDIIRDGPNALLIFRLGAVSAAVLGIASLFLTLVGLYGVMSVGVSQRTRELGVRLALGATPGHVRRGVLRQAAVLAGLGVAAGVPLAFLAFTLMRSLLVGVGLGYLIVIVVVALALVVAAMAAAYPSALRASKLDPVGALRAD